MKFIKTIFISTLMVVIVSACSNKIEGEYSWSLEEFSFTNHLNQAVSKADLDGQVWLANFIFTSCDTICPPMTGNMARIQKTIEQEGLEGVSLVSFSVDPEVDTPEKLAEFANMFTEDTKNWHFLTGYAQSYIEQFAYENFHEHVLKPENDDQVMHGTSIYLIDQKGMIIKDYDGVSNVPYEEIITDIKSVLKRN